MTGLRQSAIDQARSATTFGIILGTLGRQGNPAIVQRIQRLLRQRQPKQRGQQQQPRRRRSYLILLSEITPAKLQLLSDSTDCFVQVACPRLSVDWGHALAAGKPVLSPYELFVCLDKDTAAAAAATSSSSSSTSYPMDYYSATGGPWSNYYQSNKDRQLQRDSSVATTIKTATTPTIQT
jgi:2-(3-amino-3-carboxypropyl)histidine synthase